MAASTSSAPSRARATAGDRDEAAPPSRAQPAPVNPAEASAQSCAYVLGEDGLAKWSEVHAEAWIGLLETHKRLTRALDARLEAQHGLSLSGLEALSRLAGASGQHLRLSGLAEECGLSLSRISRIIDALEDRGLVERRGAQDDARAVHAHLTEAGLALVRRAQCSHFAAVQASFFEHLSEAEVATLAEIFARFAPRASEACMGSSTSEAGTAAPAPAAAPGSE